MEAFEKALFHQSKLSDGKTPDVGLLGNPNIDKIGGIPEYKRNKSKFKKKWPCSGCDSNDHSMMERDSRCPAWGKKCLICNTPNNFAQVYGRNR